MALLVADLQTISDEQLVEFHDQMAVNTYVGVQYYLDEIRRRQAEKAEQAALELARRAYWMTVASTVLVVASVITAIVALFVSGA
jgi:lipopolysaccharide/colanic/teichoic acid biosynthesis glycosyltransferase